MATLTKKDLLEAIEDMPMDAPIENDDTLNKLITEAYFEMKERKTE